jgi:hypothetical protein
MLCELCAVLMNLFAFLRIECLEGVAGLRGWYYRCDTGILVSNKHQNSQLTSHLSVRTTPSSLGPAANKMIATPKCLAIASAVAAIIVLERIQALYHIL